MQTILLSFIAGLLAIDLIWKNLEFNSDTPKGDIIMFIVFVLIAGAIFFGIAYGLNSLLLTNNVSF